MNLRTHLYALAVLTMGCLSTWAGPTFLEDANGKRLVEIGDKEVGLAGSGKISIHIDGKNLLKDIHDPAFMVVDDKTIWTDASQSSLKIGVFDEGTIRHGPRSTGKAVFYYKHPDISPSFHDNRVYRVDGPELTHQQLVAALYLVAPESFKLTEEEIGSQKKEMAENAAEANKEATADHIAGKWMVLNASGPVDRIGDGMITLTRKGGAYAGTFDYSKKGGPSWMGVAWTTGGRQSDEESLWAAFGTPKAIAMCVYEIDGGKLTGKWYPWYIDGDAKNTGMENLEGPDGLDGEYKISAAKAATTGKEYTGSVTIKPMNVVGSGEESKPYAITWTLGGAKVEGIGIKTGKHLIVATGFGAADVTIGKFVIHNGSFTGDFFKLGQKDMGSTAATSMN